MEINWGKEMQSSQNLVSIIIIIVLVVNICVYCCALDDRLRKTHLATPLEHH